MSESCRICGNSENNRRHTAREMMFGTREQFEYLECALCGTIQLIDVPDLSRFYPEDYYAHNDAPLLEIERGWKRRIAARAISRYLMGLPSRLGARLAKRRPWITAQFPEYIRTLVGRINFDSHILDYGCGRGDLLRTLRVFGFRDLTGADKFIKSDLTYGGVNIYKRGLDELEPGFDLVMLHHSFEHLPDPQNALAEVHRILAPGGVALIRIPVVSFAWEKYGVNWVQLDPPRHLFLYTERAFRRMADETGFAVESVTYDSEIFQFFGSEQYLADIPLNDPRSYRGVIAKSIFTQSQIDEWQVLTAKLNAEGRGDQACFILTRR
ncbi:MAG: class I SAM-dependent methyltransferase [Acidobacteriota bacterium]